MGTPEFAVPSLRQVAASGTDIAAVVTNPDEPRGRGLKLSSPPVKIAADELGIQVIQVGSLRDPEFIARLQGLEPDLMVVVAFRILPREVFTIPPKGTFNLHASLLPKYRGAAPINWAIVRGETETGVTTFFLDDKVDTGRIILQKKIPIGENETAGELSSRLSKLGAEAVMETIGLIDRDEVNLVEQDGSTATGAPKFTKDDCLIDWNRAAFEVHNFVRGFSPEPGAFTYLDSRQAKILASRLSAVPSSGRIGELKVSDGRLFVSCSDGMLELLEIQMEGKKRHSVPDFLRGARDIDGKVFARERKPAN